MNHPDQMIDPAYREQLQTIARAVDLLLNRSDAGGARKVGFTILLYPFGDQAAARANYISNGADRKDMAVLFREMAARFEGQAQTKGGRA